VLRALRLSLVTALLAAAARPLAAQAGALPPSPTLPSDTLEANYGPPTRVAPTPELSPTLPSDTLQAGRQDSSSSDSTGDSSSSLAPHDDDLLPDAAPVTPGDSAALRELKDWIRHHPGLTSPPPVRAVLVRV
jgi:hypothetical protein